MKTAKQLMGDSKGKSQQKEQECFFLLAFSIMKI